jgi:hypothetical protein
MGSAGTSSATRIAPARVSFTLWAYLGFARKVSWLEVACSIPATPVMGLAPSPTSRQPMRAASSDKSMEAACMFPDFTLSETVSPVSA